MVVRPRKKKKTKKKTLFSHLLIFFKETNGKINCFLDKNLNEKLQNCAKCINLPCKTSLWCVLLRKRPIYSDIVEWPMDSIMVSQIEMSTNNIHLLQFNIQGHLQIKYFGCRFIKTYSEEKSLKYVLFQSPFDAFSHQNS